MLRSYRYRIYPTASQQILLTKHFGCTRWIYNWALAEKTARYTEAGVNVSIYEMSRHLPELKDRPDTEWLREVAAQALVNAIHSLDSAFTTFFKGKSRYPVFKSRYDRHQSYQVTQGTRVEFSTQRIHLLKFREGIKGCFSRRFEGKVKTTTISRTPTDKYYVSVLVDTPDIEPIPPPTDELTAVGLDFGLKDLVVTSSGQRFINPRTLMRYLRRLRIHQRRLSRATKGSKRRERARLAVALTHERISNIRTNNLHQISSALTRKNQGVSTLCIEDLPVQSMLTASSRGKALNRSIQDAGWRELRRQLAYKCKWYGLNLRVIGRFEPSSKMCSNCGHIYKGLTLADREWQCVACGTHHDRDVNAARNIRAFAFREQNTSSESLLSPNYRQVSRKVTPEEQPHVAAMSRECHISVCEDRKMS